MHKFFLILIIIFSGLSATLGQSTTASLSGSVTDGNGDVITNATVKVINAATNFERVVQTNEDGDFAFINLPPANYRIDISASGFAAKIFNSVVLNVNDRRSLRVEMSAGDVAAQVIVADPSREETATVETTVARGFVENLPLNGRSFQNLIALTPGVLQTPASGLSPGQFSINGQRTNSNYYTVDGVSANFGLSAIPFGGSYDDGTVPALSNAGGTNSLVSVDALQEFKIQTSTYAPEFGRQPGGQIQIVTRSGTNNFSGSLFEYFRNEKLDANDWFANRAGLARSPVRQNDFGGVIGGPVFLPRFGEGEAQFYNGRNKTFFFVSYENLRLQQPQFASSFYPTQAQRNAVITPAGRTLINVYPLPNTSVRNAAGYGLFNASYSNPARLNATSLRIDHNFGDKATFFGRYNHASSSSSARGGAVLGISPISLSSVVTNASTTDTVTFGSTQIFSNRFTNDARFNYSRLKISADSRLDNFGGATPPSDAFLFPPGFSRDTATVGIVPIGADIFFSGAFIGRAQEQINVVDNFGYNLASHNLKFGIDFRQLTLDNKSFYSPSAVFLGLIGPFSLSSGVAAQATLTNIEAAQIRSRNWSLYAQDTWRANPRLTLTYGIRWEYNPVPMRLGDTPIYPVLNLDDPRRAVLNTTPGKLYNAQKNSFAPRIGAAYQIVTKPGRELAVRAGFGIFYDLPNGVVETAIGGAPYQTRASYVGVTFPLTAAQTTPPPFSLTARYPFTSTVAPNIKNPRTYQFNLAFEQSLGANRTLNIAYVGSLGRNLLRNEQYNFGAQSAQFDYIRLYANKASSSYNSLQTQFQQRLTSGLQILASHTWSHSIDNTSEAIYASNPPLTETNIDTERGDSNFDARHILTGSVIYNFPRLRIKNFLGQIINGWGADTIFRAQTGFPVNVFSQVTLPNIGTLNLRPNLIAGQPLYLKGNQYPGGRIFNPAAFGVSSNITDNGTLSRNALRGFPLRQIDFALRREFRFAEKLRIQLRGDVFNILNSANFAAPQSQLSSATVTPTGIVNTLNSLFGVSTSMYGRGLGLGDNNGGQNPLYSVGGPRSIQLAIKILF